MEIRLHAFLSLIRDGNERSFIFRDIKPTCWSDGDTQNTCGDSEEKTVTYMSLTEPQLLNAHKYLPIIWPL
jgi:hypothetical protein